MAWIKRNLFFTIGSVIALVLLGAAAYYSFRGWSHDRTAWGNLTQAYNDLQGYYSKQPSPGNEKINNIQTAKDQAAQLEEWTKQARGHFKTVPPIPNPAGGIVTDQMFAGTLRTTIQEIQREATNSNVELPADYVFSFAAERNLVTFAPGSLGPLASHLGEVKAICDVLFSAKVNALVQIQREVVSDNDTTGPQSDYLSDKTTTVDMGSMGQATITPYSLTFKCFSADLAKVLSRLASSDYCFIVKGINVLPAGEAEMNGQNGAPPPTPMAMPAGGSQAVLDEKLLQVTLAIEVVKLPKQ